MKKVVLFGIGINGKKMVDAYGKYEACFEITAIADNHVNGIAYQGIPVIHPKEIAQFPYDEIWIPSVYYQEMRKQLTEELGIDSAVIKYIEYPMPFIENRIYQKYKEQIAGEELCASDEMQAVVNYIAEKGVRMYCYPFFEEYMEMDVPVHYDRDNGMYYGIYCGKRMYLSSKFDTFEKARHYLRYAYMEQDKRSPHCYLDSGFEVRRGDVVIDIGAAEGIFALQVLDTAGYVYLIEADEDWCKALALTFKEYGEKVTIIKGYASEYEQDGNVVLDQLLAGKKIDLIKMDIEGAEMAALRGAESLLDTSAPKLAVCTYHKAGDTREIGEWLSEKGYTIKNSPGYVICQGEWELQDMGKVDFRRALLRAERKAENEAGSVHTEL